MLRVGIVCLWGAVIGAASLWSAGRVCAQGDNATKAEPAAKPVEVQYAELTLRGSYPEGAQSGGLLGGGGGTRSPTCSTNSTASPGTAR